RDWSSDVCSSDLGQSRLHMPATMGVDGSYIAPAVTTLEEAIAQNRLRGASLAVGIVGEETLVWAGGRRGPKEDSPPVGPWDRFLVASLSKPVVAAGVMKLVEMGAIALTTNVSSVLPEFSGDGKERVQVWHLLSHSSGLPDMTRDTLDLRERGANLD